MELYSSYRTDKVLIHQRASARVKAGPTDTLAQEEFSRQIGSPPKRPLGPKVRSFAQNLANYEFDYYCSQMKERLGLAFDC